jgi:hypothetical protein
VSGQLHALALPPRKEPSLPIGQKAGWVPESEQGSGVNLFSFLLLKRMHSCAFQHKFVLIIQVNFVGAITKSA